MGRRFVVAVRSVAVAVVALAAVGGGLPSAQAGTDEDAGVIGGLLTIVTGDGDPEYPPSMRARPPAPPEPKGPANRTSAPAPLVRPELVSATVDAGGRPAPLVIPDPALPWRFHVEADLAARYGERAVVDAVRQWDGIAGSRWATSYAGLKPSGTRDAADGSSVVFLKRDCPVGVGGYAHWQTHGAAADVRYGEAVLYVTEVDVAICDGLHGSMESIVAHEVGHAFGLGHLCDPGQACWREGMGQGPHACRLMYVGGTSCARSLTAAEHDGVVHLYPRLRRLSGPTRVDTAARASFASIPAGSAATVVVARGDGTAHGPLASAALAASLDAAFLLAFPDPEHCLTGSALNELSRVAAPTARLVLVGAWPDSCRGFTGWGLVVEMIDGDSPVTLGLAAATRGRATGRMGAVAVLVSADADARGHVPDGVAGGAAAGVVRGPVLFTGRKQLDPAVGDWLTGPGGIERVYVLGGLAALSEQVVVDLVARGLKVVRVAGTGRVETALALASRPELFKRGSDVVLAAAGGWPDAVTGSALGARSGAPVLVTPERPHPGVKLWLQAWKPQDGHVVGGLGVVPAPVQWAYSRLVR